MALAESRGHTGTQDGEHQEWKETQELATLKDWGKEAEESKQEQKGKRTRKQHCPKSSSGTVSGSQGAIGVQWREGEVRPDLRKD